MHLLLASRIFALILGSLGVIHAWPHGAHAFAVFLQCGFACLLIWFPETVDELTFGTTRAGLQIDSHTPPWMIAAVGWVLLWLRVTFELNPRWIGEAFGM